jgi:hypothetical protein
MYNKGESVQTLSFKSYLLTGFRIPINFMQIRIRIHGLENGNGSGSRVRFFLVSGQKFQRHFFQKYKEIKAVIKKCLFFSLKSKKRYFCILIFVFESDL